MLCDALELDAKNDPDMERRTGVTWNEFRGFAPDMEIFGNIKRKARQLTLDAFFVNKSEGSQEDGPQPGSSSQV